MSEHEKIISTAVESFSDNVIKKMEEAEARREREFLYRMKELEYYKSNYEKELKSIFDFWFELVRIVHIKDNKNLTQNERDRYKKRYDEMMKVDKIAKFKMDTLKYGGKETGRIFAFQNKLLQDKYNDQPFARVSSNRSPQRRKNGRNFKIRRNPLPLSRSSLTVI